MCTAVSLSRETLYNQGLFIGILNLSFGITVAFVQSLSLLGILNKADTQKARLSGAENTSCRRLDGCVTCTKLDCLTKGGTFQGHVAASPPPQPLSMGQ